MKLTLTKQYKELMKKKNWFFDGISKIGEPLAKLTKRKRGGQN
jgi:hypothetical protein